MDKIKPGLFSVEVIFEKSGDGHYRLSSPNVPGFRMAGRDLQALRSEVEPIVKDLLWHNSQIIADEIQWLPSLDEVVMRLDRPPVPSGDSRTTQILMVHVQSAA